MERNKMEKLYRRPYIDAYCQVWFHLAKLFQRRRLKYEKVNGRTTDAKWWQYLTLPFGPGELKNDEKRAITPRRVIRSDQIRACRSWQAEHVFSLHLTSISYSFWNKGWKVLTFLKFNEKRAITSRWLIRFILKLQVDLDMLNMFAV